MLTGVQAFAQTVGVGPAETLVIEPEQRAVIRESRLLDHLHYCAI